jgi:hypothetical protein
MKRFDVQAIEMQVGAARAFDYIADPSRLPEWTSAFAAVDAKGRAQLRTPQGEVEIGLIVHASPGAGTIDWEMNFPDGSRGTAFSRLVRLDDRRCIYTFVLTPPPMPLEKLEGALEVQSKTLAEELARLQGILESHG